MRLISMLVALAVVFVLMFFYLKGVQRDVELVKPSGADTTSGQSSYGYTDHARDAVEKVREAQENTQRQIDKLTD